MQRLPDHMRAMLSTRNPSDNWKRPSAMTLEEFITKYGTMTASKAVVVASRQLDIEDNYPRRKELLILISKIADDLQSALESYCGGSTKPLE